MMSDSVDMPQSRLASRIRWLLIGLACTVASVFSLGGWLLLIDAEDAIQDSYLQPLLRQLALAPKDTVMPHGIVRYWDAREISETYGLVEVPATEGLYEFFADDEGRNAIAPKSMGDRLRLWTREDREREFRFWFEPASSIHEAVWVLVDLGDHEFSDVNLSTMPWRLALLAGGIFAAAFLSSRIITSWALRPILELARRVRAREAERAVGRYVETPLAAGLPADEFGYLARVLDEYHENLRRTLDRERRFIADCSHELRTPVTTLNGAVALLRDLPADADAGERVLSRMERAGRRMERLIQTFLMIARENRLPEPTSEIAVDELVQEVVDEWRALHPAHSLVVDLEKCECVWVRCDREGLSVLIHNLVGNAFSHLREGRLEISLSHNQDRVAILRFQDDGPGLPEFVEVYQGDLDRPPRTGFGLGLSLVERLCAVQGWQIEKRPGHTGGTWIQITLAACQRHPCIDTMYQQGSSETKGDDA
jgi:signal transduction histidine kinase